MIPADNDLFNILWVGVIFKGGSFSNFREIWCIFSSDPFLVIPKSEIQPVLVLIYMTFLFWDLQMWMLLSEVQISEKTDFYLNVPVIPFSLTIFIYNENKTNLPKVIKVELNFSTFIFFLVRIKWNEKDFVRLSDN